MSDLISRSELIKDLMEQIPLAENVHIFRDIIDSQPTVSEQEIRNKAIEEFALLLSAKDNIVKYDIDEILSQSRNFDYACDCLRRYIDEIAEQMKEVGE